MTTNYIHPRVEINVRYFCNAMCGRVNTYKVLANKFLDIDKTFHAYFFGTRNSFVMNYYEFKILFICFINLITHY